MWGLQLCDIYFENRKLNEYCDKRFEEIENAQIGFIDQLPKIGTVWTQMLYIFVDDPRKWSTKKPFMSTRQHCKSIRNTKLLSVLR